VNNNCDWFENKEIIMLLVNSGSDTEIIFSKVHIQNCSAPKH
jgi:hypothetical protein